MTVIRFQGVLDEANASVVMTPSGAVALVCEHWDSEPRSETFCHVLLYSLIRWTGRARTGTHGRICHVVSTLAETFLV